MSPVRSVTYVSSRTNNLHEILLLQKPTFRGNGVGGRAEPIEKNRLEGLTSSVPRWTSYIYKVRAGASSESLQLYAGANANWVGERGGAIIPVLRI